MNKLAKVQDLLDVQQLDALLFYQIIIVDIYQISLVQVVH